jgi:hypothetical protein
MLRRVSFSAALAALAVPVLSVGIAAGPAHADPTGTPSDDPAAQAQVRKGQLHAEPQQTAAARRQAVSRRASRARAEDDAPLTLTIDKLTPSTIPERGMVRVSGTVTNNDTETWSTINIRPFISAAPLTTPAQLAEAAAQPPDAVVGERINDEQHKDFIEELAPGASTPYQVSIPRRLLGVSTPGVYWFGVHALGEGPGGRDESADGRARTFLPLVPEARPGQEPTAVVIPLRRQLVHTDDGRLDDLAGWTRSLSPGGRLRSLVDFGANSGDRTVTWVIDPALVDAVRRLADGNPPRSLAPNLQVGQPDGEDEATEDGQADPTADATASSDPSASPSAEPEPDTGSPLDLDELDPVVQAAAQAAQAWLARLGGAMRPEDQVMSLPYGDVDAAAAATHHSSLYQRAVVRAGTTLPGFDVASTPVLSSPSGYLTPQAIRDAVPGSAILLTDAMFGDDPPALADTEGHEAVVASSAAGEGGPGPDSRTSSTAMRQRLLSVAAVRCLRGDQAPLTMVVPHDWNPTDNSGAFFSGLDADWLDLTSVQGVSQAATPTPVDGSSLHYPASQEAAELPQPNFDAADKLIDSGLALQNLLTFNNIVSGTVTDQALGTVSYYARTKPIDTRASADASRVWIQNRLGRVHVDTPGRAVTLSSSSGRFQATVTNELDQPVTVSVDARTDDRLTIDTPPPIEVGANRRVSVLLTARTEENGLHEVVLAITDKRGTQLGSTTTLTIRSAQFSNVIWLFLGIGCALLFGAIAVRLFRRVRNARRGPPEDDGTRDAAEGGTADQAPAEAAPAEAATR